MFALCDLDSFYASCERVFNPKLRGRPVVVASNNDGCAVARSKEAKALGIKMGQPIFELREHVQKHGLVVCSSNYELYGDMSFRFMQVLESCAPRVMPYSIDEAFLDLTGVDNVQSFESFGRQIKESVWNLLGLPICVGVGPSPTLAKLANHAAKKYPATKGVVDLTDRERQRRLLRIVEVGDVWGIGSKLSARLNGLGIKTALQLADADPKWIRKQFSVVVERTVRELNGVPCHTDIQEMAPPKQQILCSRTFGHPVTSLDTMLAAVNQHCTTAGEKLRKENRECGRISVFLSTSRFKEAHHYGNQLGIRLGHPTADTRVLAKHATAIVRQIWRDGYRYNKAGVMLTDFRAPGEFQVDMFGPSEDAAENKELMSTLDRINSIVGRSTVRLARQLNKDKSWQMRRGNLSPAYTTRWADIPTVKA